MSLSVWAVLAGLVKPVLDVWARIDQWREARERRQADRPFCRVYVNPVVMEDGWRALKLVFVTRSGTGCEVEAIEAIKPKDMLLGNRVRGEAITIRDTMRIGRKLQVEWQIDPPRGVSGPAFQTVIFCKLPSPAERAVFHICARELSAGRKAFTIKADAKVTTKSEA